MMHPKLLPSWQELEAIKKDFENIINSESIQGQEYKPSPDAWNMLQVLQHIVISERMIVNYLLNKGLAKSKKPGGKMHILRSWFLRLMLKSPLKFKTPEVKGIEPDGNVKKEVLFQEWEKVRMELYSFLQQFPENKLNELIFRHPVVGWLTIISTLHFITDHIGHHQQQLSRIRKSNFFPASS